MNNSNFKFVVISILVSLLVIGGAVVALGNDKAPRREEQGTASVALDRTYANLGPMKTEEEKTAVFTLTNTAQSTLRIWNVKTSCDCTFAKVKIGDKESQEFSMHGGGNWLGEIPAGGKAELTVIYRPYIMPVVGKVTRQTTFDTNDPQNPRLEVGIEANVQ